MGSLFLERSIAVEFFKAPQDKCNLKPLDLRKGNNLYSWYLQNSAILIRTIYMETQHYNPEENIFIFLFCCELSLMLEHQMFAEHGLGKRNYE